MIKRILTFSLVLVLVAVTYTAALAQAEPEILACPDGEVSGVIVAYDQETGAENDHGEPGVHSKNSNKRIITANNEVSLCDGKKYG